MTPLIVGEIETAIKDAPALLTAIKDFASTFGVNIDLSSNSQQMQQARALAIAVDDACRAFVRALGENRDDGASS